MRKAVAFLKRAEAVEQRIDALLSQIELYKSLTQRVTASWGSEFTAHARNVGANENAIIRLTEARRELEKLTQEYRDAVEEITAVVNSMDNQAHRIILLNYYLSHMNFEKIAEAPPHNSAARLAMSFPPSASCKFLDLHPVNLRNLHLHLTKNPFASRPPHLRGVTLKESD